MYFRIWDSKTDYFTSDALKLSQVEEHFGVLKLAKLKQDAAVLEFQGNSEIVVAIMSLNILRDAYRIDPSLNDEEALQAYVNIRSAPPPEPEVSAEERIAAALEFYNLEQYGVASIQDIRLNYSKGLWSEAMVAESVAKGAISSGQYLSITGEAYAEESNLIAGERLYGKNTSAYH